MVYSKKWLQNHPNFLLHFLIHIDVLMLCSKFELIPTSIFQVTVILKKRQKLKSTQGYSPWFFPKKWLQNHPKFLLHFLIHIDVLMLCSKFELIPTNIFRVTAILRKLQKSKAIAHGFFQKMAPKSPQIFITFSDTY